MSCNWIDILTLVVLTCTLIAVMVYVYDTRRLLRLHQNQLVQTFRPWINVTGVRYYLRETEPRFGIVLSNTGKMPAFCKVSISSVSLERKAETGRTSSTFTPSEIGRIVVSPNLSDDHFIAIPFDKTHQEFLGHGVRIQIAVHVGYRMVNIDEAGAKFEIAVRMDMMSLDSQKVDQDAIVVVDSIT